MNSNLKPQLIGVVLFLICVGTVKADTTCNATNEKPIPAGTAVLNNCTYPNGDCYLNNTDIKSPPWCKCKDGYNGEDCAGTSPTPENRDPPTAGWTKIMWGILGVAVGLLCLDRLWSSCKKAWARRNGRPETDQFAPVNSDASMDALPTVSSVTGATPSHAEMTTGEESGTAAAITRGRGEDDQL